MRKEMGNNINIVEIILRETDSFSPFYAIIFMSDKRDEVLIHGEKILVTDNIEKAFEIASQYTEIRLNESNITGCYIADAIDFIKSSFIVPNTWLLDTVNFLLDVAHTLQIAKNNYLIVLNDFANFLTFHHNLSDYTLHNKTTILDSIYWITGILFTNIMLVE